jgi:ketosteroid isomerase-like protein
MRIRSLLGLLLLASVGMVQAQTPAKEARGAGGLRSEVMKVEDARSQALQSGDADALDRLYADDLAYTNARGQVLTKAQHLADIRSGNLKFTALKHEDVVVRVYGETGIVTGVSASVLKYNGHAFTGRRRFTNVYVKENARWLCVVHDETPIAP